MKEDSETKGAAGRMMATRDCARADGVSDSLGPACVRVCSSLVKMGCRCKVSNVRKVRF
jgi:hypothetical protein